MGDITLLSILVTCYNRKQTTIKSLSSLSKALFEQGVNHKFFVVDDNSKDGTAEAIRENIPNLVLVEGTGNLYWNGGMQEAYRASEKYSEITDYLLFNDDVIVDQGALAQCLTEYTILNKNLKCILAGSTYDETGGISYSAYIRKSKDRPLLLERVEPTGKPLRCDTFNGNFVLIPADVMRTLNGLDHHFKHSYGDLDLGLSAKKINVQSYLASSPIGVCSKNENGAIKGKSKISRALKGSWGKQDSIGQRLYFQFKHGRFLSSCLATPIIVSRYILHRLFD